MDTQVKELIVKLFDSRIRAIEELISMDITVFDRDLVEAEGRPTISERLTRLAWHDDAHTEELIRIKQILGKPGSMDRERYFATWFFTHALMARARLIGEMLDLAAEDLNQRAKPGDRTISEMIKHLIQTEQGFLVEGIRKSLDYRSPDDRVGRRTRADYEQHLQGSDEIEE